MDTDGHGKAAKVKTDKRTRTNKGTRKRRSAKKQAQKKLLGWKKVGKLVIGREHKRKSEARRTHTLEKHKDTRKKKRELLEKTWLNPHWRKKWRRRYGRKRWKHNLKEKWLGSDEWRRKWMKRLRDNWWNIKWRRRWQLLFLREDILKKYQRERRRRRKYLKRRWKKLGYMRMGLTFNEFLLTQRRLRSLKNVPSEVLQLRRRGQRLQREGRIKETKSRKSVVKKKSILNSIFQLVQKIVKEQKRAKKRPPQVRPAVIQFKFFLFNACQGIVAFTTLLFMYMWHASKVPPAFKPFGLFILLLYPTVMDFFGSVFGMIISNNLNNFYGHGPSSFETERKEKKKKWSCCGCRKVHPESEPETVADPQSSKAAVKWPIVSKTLKERLEPTAASKVNPYQDNPDSCKCKGLRFINCCIIRICFVTKKSTSLVTHMGRISYILLLMAWFFNLLFTGYYTWLANYSEDYIEAHNKCLATPDEKHCDEFHFLFIKSAIVVGTSFMLRNIFLFVIGMCISERYLKRCQSVEHPRQELPTTGSDTEMDYLKVPRQMLIPYLMSDGTYPYNLPEASHPIEDVRERHRRQKRQPKAKHGHGRTRRRLKSAQERELGKTYQNFKRIRKATIPLEKGRRIPFKLPPASGVPDTIQLPPELMTLEARIWLSEDDSSSDDFNRSWRKKKKPPTLRKKRKRVGGDSLIALHKNTSKTNLSVSDIVKPKLDGLSSRISTDESWSGDNSSLFESGSVIPSDEEVRELSGEEYFTVLAYNEDYPASYYYSFEDEEPLI